MAPFYLSLKRAEQTAKVDPSSCSGRNIKRTIVWDKNDSNSQDMKPKSYEDVLRRRKERFGEISPPKPNYPKAGQVTHVNTLGVNDLNILKKRSERFGESVSSLMKKVEQKDKMMKRQARFSSRVVISSPTSSDKQLSVKVFGKTTSPTVELFQTIDQIDAEEREKMKLQEN